MLQRFMAATRKGLFTFASTGSNGRGWKIERTDFLGDNVSMVLHDPRDNRLYAALDHGHFGVKLHRCDEAKRDWEECASPAYPPKPGDVVENDMWGRPLPWSTAKIWSLETGGPNEAGVLWCGTLPGGLFRTDDCGTSWDLVRALWDHPGRKEWMGGGADLPGIHSIAVDPRNSKTVRVGVSCGGMWHTDDGGQSWDCRATGMRAEFMPPERQYDPGIQDPHRIVQCAACPDVLWAQHHNGIFRSGDGGLSWAELKGVPVSAFGFAVVVHPSEPGTAWFVPAIKDERRIPVGGRLIVLRTRDGGETFDVLDRGLPQEHAYDLVLRHGLDIGASGHCLAFGSTTGNMWVSTDQGDGWTAVAQHLPPVYCVRFLGG